jgi:phage/plasmid-like protein (TIGR03299 family)
MAHEVETMFSARETPWHRLGVVTDDVLTAKEAIVAAGLDWSVDKYPVYDREVDIVVDEDGPHEIERFVPQEDRFFLKRSSDMHRLSIVSDVYKPFQNADAFSFMDFLVKSGEAKYETGGSLRNGAVIFISMETPRHIILPGDDTVKTYLLLRTTHDGSGRISVYVVTVRVVCMNTLTWAISGAKHSFGFTHTADVEGKIAQAREALGFTFDYEKEFEVEAKSLIDITVSDDEIVALLEGTLPVRPTKDDEIELVMANVRGSDTIANFRNGSEFTAWGALNGITEFYEHVKENRSGEALFGRILDGQQAKLRTTLKNRLLARA